MAGVLFLLGMVDHFEVRYMYASLILMPIWIALLVSTLYRCIWKLLSTESRKKPNNPFKRLLKRRVILCAFQNSKVQRDKEIV